MEEYAEIRPITLNDLEIKALKNYDRYQTTGVIKLKEPDGSFVCIHDEFIDDWDSEKKVEVVQRLRSCMESGGFVAGAFLQNSIVGFASVENSFFGSENQYLEMPFMHVSRELRGKGIGRKLFALCCENAKKRGARKLYISTHPSIESQGFYESLGCLPASEINEEIYSREPFDIQLEFSLE
ncbi:MAG: GNAT family N-acetyltransferase [Kosmotogaceae bacterium]|nr:GNAT family N-acetyltransferase [Kosmotogaceae bacterium]